MNSMEQIFKIRDSRGLDSYDKIFLMTAASRGGEGMYATWDRNKDDMGMGKDRYYKSRQSLTDKGLIKAVRRMNEPTVYKIDDAGLLAWYSATQNGDSVTQNEHSATQKTHSVRPETKKNTKKNKKKNIEEEHDESAGASSLPIEENKNNKEDQVFPPASPIGANEPVDPMVEENPGHSATQNDDDYYEWNGRKILKAGRGPSLLERAAAPVAPVVLNPCPNCSNLMDKNDLCWHMDCVA